jgi:hypothetical protein
LTNDFFRNLAQIAKDDENAHKKQQQKRVDVMSNIDKILH